MAKLSYAERIKRLERRRDELVRLKEITATTETDGLIQSVETDTLGKTIRHTFLNREQFDTYIDGKRQHDGYTDFDVVLDSEILSIGKNTMNTLIECATLDTLRVIASGSLTSDQWHDLMNAFHDLIYTGNIHKSVSESA